MIDKIKKAWVFWFGILISSALLWPLFASPYFTHHDDVQLIRTYEMDQCIRDGQIPCRWVPDLGGGYGYPIFNYYAPLPYYIGEVFYYFTHQLILSAKVIFAIPFIGSFIFMYLFGKKLWGGLGGLVSGVFYIYAPYHAVDFYVRGAMGELWALMFFPAIFWSLLRLKEKTNIGNFFLLSIFFALLILSHNLSAMIFLPIIFVSATTFFVIDHKKNFLLFTLAALSFGFLISAFYWIPAYFEKSLVHLETTIEGYFSYTEHFKGLKRLFIDRDWGYGASIREVPGGPKDGLSFQIGIIHEIVWFISVVAAVIMWKKNKNRAIIVFVFSAFILFCAFMINPRSDLIWQRIPLLAYLQFPWRFLEIIIFFTSILAGSLFSKSRSAWAGLAIVFVILLNFQYFRPEKFLNINDKQALSGSLWETQIKRSIFDYLPIYAKLPPVNLSSSNDQILTGHLRIQNYKKGSNWFSFQTNVYSLSIIRISQYYFPDWVITDNGQPITINYKNDLGLMTIILGQGDHSIIGRLYDTPIRRVCNIISFLSSLVLLGFLVLRIKKVKGFVGHYLEVLKHG